MKDRSDAARGRGESLARALALRKLLLHLDAPLSDPEQEMLERTRDASPVDVALGRRHAPDARDRAA